MSKARISAASPYAPASKWRDDKETEQATLANEQSENRDGCKCRECESDSGGATGLLEGSRRV